MKKYFLTTALLGTFIAPAYAADEIITGGAGTCTVDVLGVSDNNATANTIAVWSINEYTLNPGEYLNVTETSVDKTTCPPGSYCVGGAGFTVDNAATSIEQCPTEYPNSAAGAGAQTQCYTACTVATANIAHATAVGGNDYFGDGVDACYATACATGYHVDGDVELIEQTPLIPVDYTVAGTGSAAVEIDGDPYNYGFPDSGLTENGTWATKFDYGVVYGKASCQATHPAFAYAMENIEALQSGSMTMEEFEAGLANVVGPTEAKLFMGYGEILMGDGEGMTEDEIFERLAKYWVGTSDVNANYSTDSTGQYCYCQMEGFAPATDGVLGEKTSVTSAPWVFNYDHGSADGCASSCANYCAGYLQVGVVSRPFRAAVFGSLGTQMSGICTANTINIDWDPDNGGEHTKNMCTYDGSITLPTPDPVKPGYTFTGWKLVEKTTTTE